MTIYQTPHKMTFFQKGVTSKPVTMWVCDPSHTSQSSQPWKHRTLRTATERWHGSVWHGPCPHHSDRIPAPSAPQQSPSPWTLRIICSYLHRDKACNWTQCKSQSYCRESTFFFSVFVCLFLFTELSAHLGLTCRESKAFSQNSATASAVHYVPPKSTNCLSLLIIPKDG